jgi:hypothetical protein
MRYAEIILESSGDPVNTRIDQTVASPKFKEWFRGSKVVDEQGVPLLCFHGTNTAFDPMAFRPFSHFGTIGAAKDRLSDKAKPKKFGGSNLISVFLSIKNPLRIADMNSHMVADRIAITACQAAGVFDKAEFKSMMRLPKYKFLQVATKTLLANGIDGFVYDNIVEDKGSASWIILSADQVMPI